MEFNFTEILFALSDALDHVEHDLIGVTTYHGKRVAAIASALGKKMGLDEDSLLDLMGCAILHDCALTEYVQVEFGGQFMKAAESSKKNFELHCIKGQEYVSHIPFYGDVTDVILYHHENADGSGVLEKKADEVPVASRLIHIADTLDAIFDLSIMTKEKYQKLVNYLMNSKGTVFDKEMIFLFESVFDYQTMMFLRNEKVDLFLNDICPSKMKECTPEQLKDFAKIFAVIVDYKSHFTQKHSTGIAQKAEIMAKYYGADEELAAKMYFAGALHDIGKLIIDRDVLEKPDKLTDTEYKHIQTHAYATYKVLAGISGLEDITHWAAYHHEKLNGKGYPFGLTEDKLDKWDQMMGCLDIYQALTEDRPYKQGMEHEETMEILMQMADNGFLNRQICADIRTVFYK